jgi:GNAT superfamily N-acetyltransferase
VTVASAIERFRGYQRLHGTHATLRRLVMMLHRALFSGRMVLFVCDLPACLTVETPVCGILERKTGGAAPTPEDLVRISSHWNPPVKLRQINERFAAGAELWLLRSDGVIAAYGWTIKGKTMKPHFFPFTPKDVHCFDFYVFPEFRGRGLNSTLVEQILLKTGGDGSVRAFIESAAWNKAQLSSLKKTPFRKFGIARKFCIGRSALVLWSNSEIQK